MQRILYSGSDKPGAACASDGLDARYSAAGGDQGLDWNMLQDEARVRGGAISHMASSHLTWCGREVWGAVKLGGVWPVDAWCVASIARLPRAPKSAGRSGTGALARTGMARVSRSTRTLQRDRLPRCPLQCVGKLFAGLVLPRVAFRPSVQTYKEAGWTRRELRTIEARNGTVDIIDYDIKY